MRILGWTVDERFLMHRLRSTSIGGLAGVLLAAVLFLIDLYGKHVLRWDLFAVVATAAVVKLAVLTWYRLKD
ncbi:MAG: hypothetical protein JOZ54_21965 [Acidobacteria bacterium]|nr:hypothetical protein [Acidobacteriota bacterium]